METQTETKAPSHPYANRLQENLNTQRKMESLLETKVRLLTESVKVTEDTSNFLTNTPAEELAHCEQAIQLIKAQGELDILKKIIFEKDSYYKQYMEQFVKDIAEVDLKFKNTVAIARKSTKPNVVKLLSDINWNNVDNDDEVKIAVYKQLRKHV